ncbi:5102_t:CDS:2, partial [Racocetra persica]
YPTELHLDIHYPQYGFAIEVQGMHEKCHEFFYRDPNNFIKQQAQNQLKSHAKRIDPYIVIPEHLQKFDLA